MVMKIGNMKIDTFPLSSANLKGLVRNIYPCSVPLSVCPICGNSLRDYTMAIQVSNTDCVKMRGKACHKCDAFFSSLTKLLNGLDKERICNDSYTLHSCFNIPYDLVGHLSLFRKAKSAYGQITLCAPGDIRIYTIVSQKSEVNAKKRIVHYSDNIALDLLTAVTMNNRIVDIESMQFVWESVQYSSRIDSTINIIKPSHRVEVLEKKNGGYYSPDEDIVNVCGLVFSEKSQRLEVLPISYSKLNEMYYVDRQIYERFLLEYGYPIITPVAHFRNNWNELRDEALLHQLGYSVSEANGLTASSRHALLGRIVDNGFMDIHDIVNHLRFLIGLNSKNLKQVSACIKWQGDIDYISNYRVDPQRLVFISKIKKL